MNKLGADDRAAWIRGPSAQCESTPHAINPYRLVLLGAPGVGKGTQATLLRQRLGACHLSTGDVFRASGNRKECDLSPAMQEALTYMRRGSLVPDETVWEMVRERKGCLQCAGGFILDGFPRTLAQAESLDRLLREEGIVLTAVVNYELPEAEIVARLAGRRTCDKCKAIYHVTDRPPRVEGRCDQCDGKLFLREDDRPKSVKVRLEAYALSTQPLIEFYDTRNLLVRVAADALPDEIFEKTVAQLQSRTRRGEEGVAGGRESSLTNGQRIDGQADASPPPVSEQSSHSGIVASKPPPGQGRDLPFAGRISQFADNPRCFCSLR